MSTEHKHEMQPLDKRELEQSAETTRPGVYYEPPVDIYETDAALFLVADMPGVTAAGVEIDLREGVLTLQGHQASAEQEHVRHREYHPGNYLRRFAVSEAIDQEHIEARMTDGVLELRLPKVPKALPRRIHVSTS